jgi:hypothetical protein
MGRLVYTPVTEGREAFLADVKRLGDAASKAIATGDKSGFRLELEKTAKAAADTTKALSPLTKASEAFERAWQGGAERWPRGYLKMVTSSI